MPCRPLLLDLRAQNRTICRACLSNLQRQAAHRRAAAYSSQASEPPKPPKPRAQLPSSVTRWASRAELKKYLDGIKELQRPSKTQADDEDDFSVRFFEQKGERRTELPDSDAFDSSFGGFDGSELKELLGGIKDVLWTDAEKDAFRNVLREMGGPIGKVSSADDVERLVARVDAYNESLNAKMEEAAAGLPQGVVDELRRNFAELEPDEKSGRLSRLPCQIPEEPWTAHHRKKISKLNDVLARASRQMRKGSGVTKEMVVSVFKAYHATRWALAHGWGNVPRDVWDLLWEVLSADESVNNHRMSHISKLARDMSRAKVTLSPPQQLLTIEAVFVDGWESMATDNWKKCASSLGADESQTFQEFWELGVRMYCRLGDVDEAERAVDKLVAKQLDPRIMMPLIRTLSQKGTAEGQERAWEAYRRMRALLGKDMQLADYDRVVSYFLTTHQTENALYAFVDMMTDGSIDMKRQKTMPSVVANKFFLGKWLKRLIGAGDLAGAMSVVEYMRWKGVAAAPIHLNGLIGAWQRSGGADDLDKADRLAWDMVRSRISFVRSRREGRGGGGGGGDPSSWPRATLETFCLLAESYRIWDRRDQMRALWDAFRDAEMKADAFMMNQLIESHIQAGRPHEATAAYRSLVADRGVTPDPYTFSALWKTLTVNRLLSVPDAALGAAAAEARALFAETVRFRRVFGPGGMDGQLARKVLHTFRLARDGHGFLVALRALADVFGFLPPELLVLELAIGTTRLAWDTPRQRRRLLVAKHAIDEDLAAAGGGAGTADDDAAADEPGGRARGEALLGHLRRLYRPADGRSDDEHAEALVEAAREMGVYDLLLPQGALPQGVETRGGEGQGSAELVRSGGGGLSR